MHVPLVSVSAATSAHLQHTYGDLCHPLQADIDLSIPYFIDTAVVTVQAWMAIPPNKATTDFMSWAERSFLNRKKIDAFPKTLAKENVSEHVAETANFNNSQE